MGHPEKSLSSDSLDVPLGSEAVLIGVDGRRAHRLADASTLVVHAFHHSPDAIQRRRTGLANDETRPAGPARD